MLPLLTDEDLASIDALQQRLEHWLREDYHLKRHGGIAHEAARPLPRRRRADPDPAPRPDEIDHAFMGRITRVVRNDATVKVDGTFYEVPPDYIGARVDLRFPVGRPDELVLYRDDKPVGPIQPVDPGDNARFHARPVELNYAELVRRCQDEADRS